MESVAALGAFGKTVTSLGGPLYEEYNNVHKTFQDLESSLKSAQKLLQPINLSQDNETLQDRVKKLQRICYDVEDFIDDMKRRIEERDPLNRHRDNTRHAARSFRNLWKPHQIKSMLTVLQIAMDEVKTNQQPINDGEAIVPPDGINFHFNQPETMGVEENIVSNIIEKLISKDSKGVSIVGIRGLGKRALAKYIICQEKVRAKFPLILKASFSGNPFDISNLKPICLDNEPVQEVDQRSVLLNQQWLLWMDDLSHMPLDKWEEFKGSYLKNADGNRKVIFTTLNPDVATTTKTFLYYMKPLPDKCCQDLINKALETNDLSHESFEYGSIKAVAKKCYGLPLVAKHLGSALCKYNEGYQHIVVNELWCLSEFKEALLPYLASSFQSLKGNSLKCFYYLSLFPQAHQFHKEDLIRLWIGAGLIQSQARVSSFLTDPSCFKDLLKNSILQPLSTKQGSPYQMNKFTHSFAQFAAPKIYVRWNEGSQPADLDDVDVCHLSLTCNIPPQNSSSKQREVLWEKIKTRKCLRTFLSIYDATPGQLNNIPPDLFKELTKLRVLVLKNTNIRSVPSLKSLKLLRLLDISQTNLEEFPNLTSHTLQILKFKRQGIPLDLPKNFNKLKNLVFVDWEVNDIRKLRSKPDYIGKLINLETLPLFVVGEREGYHIGELKHMNRLQKSICISNLEATARGADAADAEISMKTSLERLELQWTKPQIGNSLEVLIGLKPHDRLRELQIVNYGGLSFPPWFSQPSFALRKVHLKKCTNCNTLPSFSELPALEEIHLEEMPRLKLIYQLLRGTSLKSLVLSDMEALEDWIELRVKDMPRFCQLKVKKCQKLKSLPSLAHLTSLVAIEIEDCGTLFCPPKLPSSQTSLTIDKSKLLKKWWQSPGGKGWPWANQNRLKVTIDGVAMPEISQIHHSQQGSAPIIPLRLERSKSFPSIKLKKASLARSICPQM